MAQCPEGYGNRTFQEWMPSDKTPKGLLEDISRSFILGGHKAAAIAKIAANAHIILITNEAWAKERPVGMKIYTDVHRGMEAALQLAGKDALYGVFPYGGSTLPGISK